MSRPFHVFLTDGFQRKTLAAVRALGSSGLRVCVGESTRLAASFFSRWAHGRVIYPPPATGERRFIDRLVSLCERIRPDVLMPMEEETLVCILRHRERFEPAVKIPFTDLVRIERARDKKYTHALADRLGLPVPEAADPDHPTLPAVVKPRVGSGARGRVYCDTAEEVRDAVRSVSPRYGPVLVQERLPSGGEAVCVSMLYGKDRRLKGHFTHRRLREFPVDGGPSTYRESIRLPEVEGYAKTILDAMEWEGVASVEFKKDVRDGKYKFLEINPRFWGSLNLAVKAGMNFPLHLYAMAMGIDLPIQPYRTGVRSRWVFPGEIMHFARRGAPVKLIKELWAAAGRGIHDDFFEPGDGRPLAGAMASTAALICRPEFRQFVRR